MCYSAPFFCLVLLGFGASCGSFPRPPLPPRSGALLTRPSPYLYSQGFDPLSFSDYFDIKWLREAEIKHGRVAMLAALGFVLQQWWTLPGLAPSPDSNLAPMAVGVSPMAQIVVWMGVLEFWTNKGNVTMETMFSDPTRVPGEFGFDPLGLSVGKTKEQKEFYQLAEIKNGR